jgi:hypothetical protein
VYLGEVLIALKLHFGLSHVSISFPKHVSSWSGFIYMQAFRIQAQIFIIYLSSEIPHYQLVIPCVAQSINQPPSEWLISPPTTESPLRHNHFYCYRSHKPALQPQYSRPTTKFRPTFKSDHSPQFPPCQHHYNQCYPSKDPDYRPGATSLQNLSSLKCNTNRL